MAINTLPGMARMIGAGLGVKPLSELLKPIAPLPKPVVEGDDIEKPIVVFPKPTTAAPWTQVPVGIPKPIVGDVEDFSGLSAPKPQWAMFGTDEGRRAMAAAAAISQLAQFKK